MLEIPVGRRVALALKFALAVPAGRRVPLAFGPVEPPPPPPPPVEVIGNLMAVGALRWDGLAEQNYRRWVAGWKPLLAQVSARAPGWGGQIALRALTAGLWDSGLPVRAASAPVWGGAVPVGGGLQAPWRSPALHASSRGLAWAGLMSGRPSAHASPWRHPPLLSRTAALPWRYFGALAVRDLRALWRVPPQAQRIHRIRWGQGNGLEWVVRPPPRPAPPPPPRYTNGRQAALRFMCHEYAHPPMRVPIRFGQPACFAARPRQRAYVVLNQISVVRLPDRLPIEVDRVSIAGGRDGAYWDAALSLANTGQLDALAPTVDGPRRVEITINGYAWVVAIEAFDQAKVFGATEVGVRGRSVTVQLGDPYAAPRTREVLQARTMVQLADAEVDGSGITVDYGAVDWLVPAGAWYYDGLTPMAALVRLAEASGAVVQSHPVDPVVQIRPRFPASPWHWTTTAPDVVIQDDIVTGTRLQLQSRPMFDAVIVAGERVGVAAKVKRDGEAGQTFAPQQVDQLITHADGARERGRNVLGDRGGQAIVEQDIPLFGGTLQPGQPGLVLPLTLAQRVTGEGTWHGLVVGVRIEASRQDKAIDVVQTVTLERHYTDAD